MDLNATDSLCLYWKNVALKTDTICKYEMQKFEQIKSANESLQMALNKEKKRKQNICIGVGIGVGVGGTLLGALLGTLLTR